MAHINIGTFRVKRNKVQLQLLKSSKSTQCDSSSPSRILLLDINVHFGCLYLHKIRVFYENLLIFFWCIVHTAVHVHVYAGYAFGFSSRRCFFLWVGIFDTWNCAQKNFTSDFLLFFWIIFKQIREKKYIPNWELYEHQAVGNIRFIIHLWLYVSMSWISF